MRRRTFLAASAATTLALPGATRAASKQVLKFVPQADLAVLDPILTTAGVTRSHGYLVFDTLYGVTGPEDGFKAMPQMAAGHRVEDDGKTWKVTLRDGLAFHDGQKVLARDCVASIRRWGERDTFGQALIARIDEVSASDDKTITFRLKRSFPMLPDALGKRLPSICAIMPERLASDRSRTSRSPRWSEADPTASRRMNGCRARCSSTSALRATSPVEDSDTNWTSDQRSRTSIASTGISSRTQRPRARRCNRAKSIGGSCRSSDLLPVLQRSGKVRVAITDPTGNYGLLRPNHLYPPFDNPASPSRLAWRDRPERIHGRGDW